MTILSGPTRCKFYDGWEVIVALGVYSDKLAASAFEALPKSIEIDGRGYRKAGMKASDCTAYYRRSAK